MLTTQQQRPQRTAETKAQTIKRAAEICGSLSNPSKMPCFGYSLPATACQTGAKLVKGAPDSTCAKCYALRGHYRRHNVQKALQKRLHAVQTDLPSWTAAMVELITAQEKSAFFRWHDSGDVQSLAHLLAIFDVCEKTPHLQHWLPTREFSYVREALALRPKPKNLVIRLSALMRNAAPPAKLAERLGVKTSTVGHSASKTICEAGKRGGVCGDCRACWSESVANVDYPLH